jgi:alkaline phosphatase
MAGCLGNPVEAPRPSSTVPSATPSPDATSTVLAEQTPPATVPRPPAVRNVILLIADGAGFAHLEAARAFEQGRDGALRTEQLPYQGEVSTSPLGGGITDSAAAATAIATGRKVENGIISVDSTGAPVQTILEAARDSGRSTGVIATSTVTHATPGAFYAHVEDRNEQNEIAVQALEGRVDLILGGGLRHFIPNGAVAGGDTETPCPSQRRDRRELLSQFSEAGYAAVFDAESLRQAVSLPVIGLFACSNMSYDLERAAGEPSLSEMTAEALRLLGADPDGFFLMVEGSRVDSASTRWDGANTMGDMLAFDRAVAEAVDFASGRDDTLVIVTADHETGGLEVLPASPAGNTARGVQHFTSEGPGRERFDLRWTVEGHTALNVFIAADGPGASLVRRVRDNTEVFSVMASMMGLAEVPLLPTPDPSAPVLPTPVRIDRVEPDCMSEVEKAARAGDPVVPGEPGTLRIGLTGHTNIWWDGTTRDGDTNASRVERMTEFMDSQGVDLAVWLGDDLHICQPAEVEAFTGGLSSGDTPLRKLLGNHDLDDFHGELATEEQLQRFRALFGVEPYSYLDAGGFRLVFLADESADGLSYVSAEQLEFFKEALATAPGPVVVFSHHVLPVRRQENLNAMVGAGSKNTAAVLSAALEHGNMAVWVWNQQFVTGRDPAQRSGVVEYTPSFVTAYVDGVFNDRLAATVLTLRDGTATLDVYDADSNALLESFEFDILSAG